MSNVFLILLLLFFILWLILILFFILFRVTDVKNVMWSHSIIYVCVIHRLVSCSYLQVHLYASVLQEPFHNCCEGTSTLNTLQTTCRCIHYHTYVGSSRRDKLLPTDAILELSSSDVLYTILYIAVITLSACYCLQGCIQ